VIVFTVRAFFWQIQHRVRIAWRALRTGDSFQRGYVLGRMDERLGRPRRMHARDRSIPRLAPVVNLHIGRHRAVEDDVRREA
jgi:hypothetical protein